MAFAEYPVVSGGSGGITKVADSIERNALTPADGDIVIQLDNDFLYEWNGSSWAVLADRTWQTAGSILGAKTFDTASRWSVATNQQVFGVTNTTTVNYAAPSANRVYTVPDVGADADYVLTAGNQTIGGTKTFSSTISGSISGNAGTVTNGAYVNVGNVFTLAQSITASSNQLVLHSGVNQVTINSGTSAAARTYTIPDAGTTADFVMSAGSSTIAGARTFSSAVTINPASNQVVLSSGVSQLTLNSGTSAAARTYTVPDTGTTDTFAMLGGSQTFSALKTFSSGLAISGGSAANNTIWVASSTLNIRGGTSGTDIYNTSGNVVVDITDAGAVSVPTATTHIFGNSSGAATTAVVVDAANTQQRDVIIRSGGTTHFGLRVNTSNACYLISNSQTINFSGDAGTTVHGSMTSTGVWTLGATSGSSKHTIRASASTVLAIDNTTVSAQASQIDFNKNGVTKFTIGTDNSSYGIDGFFFYNGSALVGGTTQAGAWTLGASTTARHTFNGNIRLLAGADTFTSGDNFRFSSNQLVIYGGTNGLLFVDSANISAKGSMTDSGAWTLGPSGFNAEHRINSSTTTAAPPTNGTAGALTANPAGYIVISVNGTLRRIPYYNN